MGDERYPRGGNPRDEYDNRSRSEQRGYGSDRDRDADTRDYGGPPRFGDDRPRGPARFDAPRQGDRGGPAGYRPHAEQDRDGDMQTYDYGHSNYTRGAPRWDAAPRPRSPDPQPDPRGRDHDRNEYGARQHNDRQNGERGRPDDRGRAPQRDEHDDRGFFDRAGDEVRSWFGDEEAERRREQDQRYDEQSGRTGYTVHDSDYHSWRSDQIASFDRDYDDYRRENRARFEREFAEWRANRQAQRDALTRVTEQQEVVGSDGGHVGTVDAVRGDRIVLTRTDQDAEGRHRAIPSRWIGTVSERVTLTKTAAEAKQAWHDEEQRTGTQTPAGGDAPRGVSPA